MSIMDMHEGPHLNNDKKAIAGTKQTKKPLRDGSLKRRQHRLANSRFRPPV